jgi:hypothetical protein
MNVAEKGDEEMQLVTGDGTGMPLFIAIPGTESLDFEISPSSNI